MRNGKVIERVSKIYDVLERRTEVNAEEMTKVLNEPKGTVSVCLSYMVRTGYLYRSNSLYSIRKKTDSREVALQIRKLILEDKAVRKQRALINSRSLFDQPKERPTKIELAIELLKTNGYKILKPVTEFTEI